MALQEVGIKFTEEKYATKEEVKAAYNMSMIDDIWAKVISYRNNFSHQLGLFNIDNVPLYFVMTKTLQTKVSSIERKLSKILVRYFALSEVEKANLKDELYIKFFAEIASSNNFEASRDMLLHVIHKDISAFPANYTPLFYYSNTLDYFTLHRFDPFDARLISHVNKKLGGEEVNDVPTLQPSYRQTEIETSHYYQNDYIYKAAPIEQLPTLIQSLNDFAAREDISPLVRALTALFYVDYIKPFEYLNEETSALFAKLILAKSDYEEAGFFPLLEVIAFDNSKKAKEIKELTQKTYDLTYFINHYISIIESDIEDIAFIINKIEAEAVDNELHAVSNYNYEEVDNDSREEKVYTNAVENTPVKEEHLPPTTLPTSLVGKSEVALPVFPSGIEEGAIDSIVTNLLEVYPYLKKTQAHFYATHCTIGKHYTIAQFRQEEDVAYETARTSMDFLADQGFYSKTQVRNKFVYSPIPRR